MTDFARHRNRIGDLLLLPKQFNASYSDDTYAQKLPHYFGQNLLAASLNELSYTRKERDRATKAEEQARLRAQDAEEHGELYRREVSRLKDEVEELTPVKRELEEHRRYGEAQMLEAKAVARNEAEALAHEVPRACSISRRLSATEGIVLCCR